MRAWLFARTRQRRAAERISRGPLILVVEDHADTQTCVAEQLADRGFEVVTAADGEAAMRSIRERRPALVYLDMNLPTLSGYDVCEQVRADPALQDLRIVMTSAQTSVAVRAACMDAGADAFVPKPFQLDAFANLIERMIAPSNADGTKHES